jgi:hypothetical protein
MMTFVGGFLRKGAMKPRVNEWCRHDCNAWSVDYLLPLGVLKLNGRIIWIVQFSGFGRERYPPGRDRARHGQPAEHARGRIAGAGAWDLGLADPEGLAHATRALLALSLGVLATEFGLRASADQKAFTLAVMRRDGVIVPFANYSGGNWSKRWPTPFVDADVPITLRDVPGKWWGREGPSTTWTCLPFGASPADPRDGAVLFDTHCVEHRAQDRFRGVEPIPPPFLHHHPKDGLAVTGDLPIERIEARRGVA